MIFLFLEFKVFFNSPTIYIVPCYFYYIFFITIPTILLSARILYVWKISSPGASHYYGNTHTSSEPKKTFLTLYYIVIIPFQLYLRILASGFMKVHVLVFFQIVSAPNHSFAIKKKIISCCVQNNCRPYLRF